MTDEQHHQFLHWREDVPQTTNPLRFLIFSSKPYRVSMVLAIMAVIIGSVLSASSSYMLKLIVNAALALSSGGPVSALWYAAIAYILVATLAPLFYRASGFAGMLWATGVRSTTRYALSSYVIKHSLNYFSDRFAGSLSSKVTHASNGVREMVSQITWQFTGFIVTLIVGFVFIFDANPLLGWGFVLWVLIITPMNVFLVRKRIPLTNASQKAETALNGATVDMFTNITAVFEYARRSFELVRLQSLIAHRHESGLRNWRYGEIVLLVNGLVQNVFVGSFILITISLLMRGVISAGDIVLLIGMVSMMGDRIMHIGNQLNSFSETWGVVQEALEDIIVPHDVADRPNARDVEHVSGAITFDHVSFRYHDTNVLNDVSFSLKPGERVGLVGRSGAGKSTLVKVLLRHYDLDGGTITIDGVDIADMTKESLRNAIAIVPQEPMLFHRSIRDNIAYGKPDATDDEVKDAAHKAEANGFIETLEGGYDAMVGERGVKLSGGQRQRIAIARAILKDAPILLLDEATSSLDSESEAEVQKALLSLMENRTVIAIAHRLSTLRVMDRIIVMDAGVIVEDGSHEELIARGGLYASLWNRQAGGFIEM